MNYVRVCLLLVLTVFSGRLMAADSDLLRSDLNYDSIVNNYDLATLANEWLNIGQPYAPVTKPFPGPAELRCSQTQRNTVLARPMGDYLRP